MEFCVFAIIKMRYLRDSNDASYHGKLYAPFCIFDMRLVAKLAELQYKNGQIIIHAKPIKL